MIVLASCFRSLLSQGENGVVPELLASPRRFLRSAPEWPWLAFSSFLKEPDYVKTGKAIAIEPDAKIKSGSDTSMRVRAICNYDLRTGRVEDVIMIER